MNKNLTEGINIEFKQAQKLPNSFWETYSAFANTHGGTIYLGVTEGKYNKWIGVDFPEKIIKDLFNLLSNKQKVSCNLISDDDIEYIHINNSNRKVIAIRVKEARPNQKPVYLKDNMKESYKRLGEADIKLTEEELKYLIAYSNDDIDSELLENYDESDLNLDTINVYKKLLIEKTRNDRYENMSVKDFLIEIGVFKKDRKTNEYKLTSGGLIFFGKFNSITDRYPKFQLDYFRKTNSLANRWEDRVSTGDMLYPDLNMFDFYRIVSEKIFETTNDKFQLDKTTSTRLPFKTDLYESLREAFINCLMHAYYDFDSPIVITAYDDYYDFKNPGKMKISIPEFIHGGTSKIVNGTISSLFRRIGLSEKAGSGGPEIFDISKKYDLKMPEIKTSFDSTIVSIWKVDLLSTYSNLEENHRKILEYIVANGSVTKKDALEKIKITHYAFRNSIKYLLDNGYVRKTGNSRSTVYVIPMTLEESYHVFKKQLKDIGDLLQ